jgi:hypothetical protein
MAVNKEFLVDRLSSVKWRIDKSVRASLMGETVGEEEDPPLSEREARMQELRNAIQANFPRGLGRLDELNHIIDSITPHPPNEKEILENWSRNPELLERLDRIYKGYRNLTVTQFLTLLNSIKDEVNPLG